MQCPRTHPDLHAVALHTDQQHAFLDASPAAARGAGAADEPAPAAGAELSSSWNTFVSMRAFKPKRASVSLYSSLCVVAWKLQNNKDGEKGTEVMRR